ncbi:hypothetical protein llap_17017 [Limosa lapponica baueri]|uniref:Uncharacterized protein n=1 Tax=Limosa lapponica baueri TaxID=1758121 RepID=A0A2I0TFV3_LIMLA|nr:hypothetical protein llap_17017 [Limosa lapponica baueri]
MAYSFKLLQQKTVVIAPLAQVLTDIAPSRSGSVAFGRLYVDFPKYTGLGSFHIFDITRDFDLADRYAEITAQARYSNRNAQLDHNTNTSPIAILSTLTVTTLGISSRWEEIAVFLGMIQRLAQGGTTLNRDAVCGHPPVGGRSTDPTTTSCGLQHKVSVGSRNLNLHAWDMVICVAGDVRFGC